MSIESKRTPSVGNVARQRTAPIEANSRVGLAMLRHAYTCAQDAGADLWDFALEIDTLYSAGLTISSLRWLVAKQFARHGQESSVYGGPHRSFRPGAGYFFEPTTCVVLTPGGAAFADHFLNTFAASPQLTRPIGTAFLASGKIAELENEPPAPHNLNGSTEAACKPCWNSIRRELSLGDMVIKRFRVPAQNQQLILSAFEEEAWPEHIDDPLPGGGDIDPHTRLHDAIHRLNGRQTNRLLRFRGNGNGTGVSWDLRVPVALRRTSISGPTHT